MTMCAARNGDICTCQPQEGVRCRAVDKLERELAAVRAERDEALVSIGIEVRRTKAAIASRDALAAALRDAESMLRIARGWGQGVISAHRIKSIEGAADAARAALAAHGAKQ